MNHAPANPLVCFFEELGIEPMALRLLYNLRYTPINKYCFMYFTFGVTSI
jgi:hypothetical protein